MITRNLLGILVEAYYDVQEVRLETQGRIRSSPEIGLNQQELEMLLEWTGAGKIVKDDALKPQSVVFRFLYATWRDQMLQERRLKAMILKGLKSYPVWDMWLKGVKGIGPCLAGGLIAWLDPTRFDTVSKLWRYCGQDVVDGAAPKRKRGEKIHWNPKAKVHCWKIGQSFVRCGDGYRQLYDQFKAAYQAQHPEPVPCDPPRKKKDGTPLMRFTPGHINAMAERKARKIFLAHYWEKCREAAGLPVRVPYAEEKLGHTTMIEPRCC